jgi:hypothetical protein
MAKADLKILKHHYLPMKAANLSLASQQNNILAAMHSCLLS